MMRATAYQVIKNAWVAEKMRRSTHRRENRCAGPVPQTKKMRGGGNRRFLVGKATTGVEGKKCAGDKFDARGAKRMRGRGRPGKGKCAAPQAQEKTMRGCTRRPMKRMRGDQKGTQRGARDTRGGDVAPVSSLVTRAGQLACACARMSLGQGIGFQINCLSEFSCPRKF